MSSTPFGEHLKREREMRGVSLEEISAATRIGTRFLQAIENEQWDQLPGGVFNRGFIRSIARFLGLDEDNLVAEYALVTGSQMAAAPAAENSWETSRNWLPFTAALIVILLVIAGGAAIWHLYGSRIVAKFARHHSAASSASANTEKRATVPDSPSAPVAASGLPIPVDPGSAAASAALSLKVTALKSAYVKIEADGQTLFEGTLQSADVKQFKADKNFEITPGEQGDLQLELNGQPVRPQEQSGSDGVITLARDNLKAPEGGPH